MTEDLQEVLTRAAALMPDAPGRLEGVRARRAVLVRRRQARAGGALIAVVALAVGGVFLASGSSQPTRLDEGRDLYTASGDVVAVTGQPVRLCFRENEISMLELTEPPTPNGPSRECRYGIEVTGLDLDRIADRQQGADVVFGKARVTGTFADGVLNAESQGPPDPAPSHLTYLQDPPCPAPEGGWPRGRGNENLDYQAVEDYEAGHPGAIVEKAGFRPSSNQVLMYLLTTDDPAPVDAALRPTYGARLCVVRSLFTKSQIETAFNDPDLFRRPLGESVLHELGPDGQLRVIVHTVYVTPELQAAADRYPKGLVTLVPEVHPAD